MNQTNRRLSLVSSTVLLAAIAGCGGSSLDGSKDAGAGGSGGGTQVGTGGTPSGSGGSGNGSGGVSGTGGTGGAHSDAAQSTGGTSGTGGSGGASIDVAGGTGGTSGTGGARSDATVADDARADARTDAAGSCPSAFNATACVACCGALYPGAADQAFFGNECLYCTATCRETTICRGVASAGAMEINGPCLKCAQPYIAKSDCPATSGPKCEAFLECLKACPTN